MLRLWVSVTKSVISHHFAQITVFASSTFLLENRNASPTKISNSIFQLEFFQDWELAQNQLDTTGHNWVQLDFFPTHFRPNWTRLDICWEIKLPIGNILRGEIHNWKKLNPTGYGWQL